MTGSTVLRENMRIRELQEKDAALMLEWMHDPDVNRWFKNDFAASNLETVTNFIAASGDDAACVHYAVVDDSDEYLGTVSLKNIDKEAENAEYAISLRSAAHGTGAAAFATDAVLEAAFCRLGLKRVYLNVLSENVRANRFYRKYGFIYEGAFRKHILVGGELKDLSWYSMLAEEFLRSREVRA